MTRDMREARRIWTEALLASLSRQRGQASEWLLAAMEREALVRGIDSAASVGAVVDRRRREASGLGMTAVESKRRQRLDPAYRAREYERHCERHGVLPREERLALVRARSEATRDEREQRKREKARQRYIERAEEKRERMRQRRAAMTIEERRAEWREHQRARRARLRAQQEAAE